MGKGRKGRKGRKERKGTQNIVGSAAVGAARGEGAGGSGAGFALEGMGLGVLPTGDVGGSGEEIMLAEPPRPPAHSLPGRCSLLGRTPVRGARQQGGGTATAGLTLEQQGAATREAFRKDARVKKAAALQAAGEERRAERLLLRAGAAPGEGAVERTGLGAGYGVFDAVYTPPAEEVPMVRYGRNYSDRTRWTEEAVQDWQARFSTLKDEWGCQNVTVRLFKASWQGQELSRESIVRVMQQVLEPIGEVQDNQLFWRCTLRCLTAKGCGPTRMRRC